MEDVQEVHRKYNNYFPKAKCYKESCQARHRPRATRQCTLGNFEQPGRHSSKELKSALEKASGEKAVLSAWFPIVQCDQVMEKQCAQMEGL